MFILDYCRTPIGSLNGSLSRLTSLDLLVATFKGLEETPKHVEAVVVGTVLPCGSGQNLARSFASKVGLECPSYVIGRVCSSSMESLRLASTFLDTHRPACVVVGGVESMSNAVHYVECRKGKKFGNLPLVDSLVHDGLADENSGKPMAEVAGEHNVNAGVTRESQDEWAARSYELAADIDPAAHRIVPVNTRSGVVNKDEELSRSSSLLKLQGLKELYPGGVTAGNASKLSDGAAIMVVANEAYIAEKKATYFAKLSGVLSVAGDPSRFQSLPVKAALALLANHDTSLEAMDLIEVNEAFSSTPLLFIEGTGVERHRVNVSGGAVAMGHPLGCSGLRICTTLVSNMRSRGARKGLAAICNGGGGACAVLIDAYQTD